MTNDLRSYANAAAALAGVLVIWWIWKNGVAGAAAKIVGGAADAVSGAVVGIGGVVGISPTDPARCAAAKASGSAFDVSKYCPAGDFLSWSASRLLGRSPAPGMIQKVITPADISDDDPGASGPDGWDPWE